MLSKFFCKAKYILFSIAKSIYTFFVEEGWLILIYTVLIFLPEFKRNPYGLELIKSCLTSLPFGFVMAIVICIIGRVLQRIDNRFGLCVFRKWWHIVCHVIIYVVAFFGVYLLTAFGLRIDYEAFLCVLQTNPNEAHEFVSMYLFEKSLLLCVLVFVAIGVAEWLVLRFSHKFNIFRYKLVVSLCVGYASLGLFLSHHVYSAIKETNPFVAFGEAWRIADNSFVRIGLSVGLTKESLNMGRVLEQHIEDTRVKSATQYVGNIVLIIGESHSKMHSSLYGYNKPTNPKLELMKDSLCVFQDVITYKSRTDIAMREILSVSSVDDDIEWNEATLFPAVFKAAGWNVVLCSNQITNTISKDDTWNAALDAFLNTPKVSSACFTTRNQSTFKYDEQMVDSLIINRKNDIDVRRPSLYILQLMGQHIKYNERFNKEQAYFTMGNYSERKNLTKSQKKIVADYDNACRYNDEQLYKLFKGFEEEDAIIIYMADHGEEVYDFRDKQGRFPGLKEYAPISYHCQIDVPFVVYMTETYKRNHPEKAKQVECAVSRPFMTDDICHMLFCLGEVDTEWYEPKRCLIHENYNTKRKRKLYDGEYYEDWVK